MGLALLAYKKGSNKEPHILFPPVVIFSIKFVMICCVVCGGLPLVRVEAVVTILLQVHGEASEAVAEAGLWAVASLSSDYANYTRLIEAGACAGVKSRLTALCEDAFMVLLQSDACWQ